MKTNFANNAYLEWIPIEITDETDDLYYDMHNV